VPRLAGPLRHLPAVGLVAVLAFVTVTVGRTGSVAAHQPAEALALAKRTLDATSGVRFRLRTDDLPDGVTAPTSAAGVLTDAPAFQGEITAPVKGLTVAVDVIAVDGEVHAKFPFVQEYAEIDPEDYGVPDPATLLDPDTGLPSLLSSGEHVRRGESIRGGAGNRTVVTEYAATLPGDTVAGVIPGSEGDFAATYTIGSDGALDAAVLTGHFNGLDSPANTYTLTIDDYGVEQRIEAP